MSENNLLDLTVREIAAELPRLSSDSLVALRDAEAAGKTRKGVIDAIDEELAARDTLSAADEPSITLDVPPVTVEDFADSVPLPVAELRILRADYTGELCEIVVSTAAGKQAFTGTGETREAAYRSAVAAWLASEGKALA